MSRSSILVLVIVVLVLLFVIGVTTLFITKSHREAAYKNLQMQSIITMHKSMTDQTLHQLRADIVGP